MTFDLHGIIDKGNAEFTTIQIIMAYLDQ